jgi:pre-rRNA-processing protein TSR2
MNRTVIRRSKFELGVSLTLNAWPALTLAVQNQWGGPDSSGKRDWFAGAICDLFPSDAHVESVEERLLQIMEDEFEVEPDDDSVGNVADRIMLVWEETGRGEFGTVDAMFERWRDGQGATVQGVLVGGEGNESVDEESGEDDEEDSDEEMGDAPPELVPVKEKKAPEVDEDGFTKVPARRKR